MALGSKVVDFIRTHKRHDLHYRHRVAEISIMEMKIGMTFEVGDALTEVDRRAADGAMNVIAFFEKKLSEKRTILTGDAVISAFFIR